MNTDLIETSDFVNIAEDLQKDDNFLTVVADLKEQGKFIEILDRDSNDLYLTRYYFLNLRPFARLVIHNFHRSDVDGLHDHPWAFENYILTGGYWEDTLEGTFWREPGYHGKQAADAFHRVQLDPEKAGGETWTLFLMGPKEKEWGFLDNEVKWVRHDVYLERRKQTVLKGK